MSRNKIKFRHSFVSAQVFGLPSSTGPLGFPNKVCDTYVILKNDLTKTIERKLNEFIFELHKIDRLSQKEYFYLRSTDGIAPRIYGLPKIHKPDWPLRPIVSFINLPLYNLSKFVAKILTLLINSNNLSIKNSFELIDRISNFKINDNNLMLLFDVVSLFTNTKIPAHIAKSVIFDRLKCDSELKIRCKLNVNEIMNALDLCLDNTYLCFRKKFYREIFGVAMGCGCDPSLWLIWLWNLLKIKC